MFQVKTYLANSSIHGVGVYAGEDIKKGTLVWEWTDGVDQTFAHEEVEKMSPKIREYFVRYAWLENGKYFLCADNGKYCNHSDDPNVVDGPGGCQLAARDIKKGEEITDNYRLYDDLSKGQNFEEELIAAAK